VPLPSPTRAVHFGPPQPTTPTLPAQLPWPALHAYLSSLTILSISLPFLFCHRSRRKSPRVRDSLAPRCPSDQPLLLPWGIGHASTQQQERPAEVAPQSAGGANGSTRRATRVEPHVAQHREVGRRWEQVQCRRWGSCEDHCGAALRRSEGSLLRGDGDLVDRPTQRSAGAPAAGGSLQPQPVQPVSRRVSCKCHCQASPALAATSRLLELHCTRVSCVLMPI
jgi:hypothetical protein